MGMPNPQNCPFCLGHVDPIYYTHAVADPTHHPKRHAYPISRFATATVHFPDRPTNRQMDTHTHTHTHRLTDGLGDKWYSHKIVIRQ